jgi:DNA/RNA endonuclease G (NUC1)
MKKLVLMCLISLTTFAQKVVTNNNLIINHGDIVLYLTKDTCTMVSKHTLSYNNFLKLDKERDNKWFQDVYKGKYKKDDYTHTGYDLGHLTPSHITSYDNTLNHNSFSLFNQAPQLANFNRGKWAQLESNVEDTIAKYKTDVVIITGVIYEPNKKSLPKSRIPIPKTYFKVLYVGKNKFCWVGSNVNGEIVTITLNNLNDLFRLNKQELILK